MSTFFGPLGSENATLDSAVFFGEAGVLREISRGLTVREELSAPRVELQWLRQALDREDLWKNFAAFMSKISDADEETMARLFLEFEQSVHEWRAPGDSPGSTVVRRNYGVTIDGVPGLESHFLDQEREGLTILHGRRPGSMVQSRGDWEFHFRLIAFTAERRTSAGLERLETDVSGFSNYGIYEAKLTEEQTMDGLREALRVLGLPPLENVGLLIRWSCYGSTEY